MFCSCCWGPWVVRGFSDSENQYIDKEGIAHELEDNVKTLVKGERSGIPSFVSIYEPTEEETQEIERRLREYIKLKEIIEGVTLEFNEIEKAREKIFENVITERGEKN